MKILPNLLLLALSGFFLSGCTVHTPAASMHYGVHIASPPTFYSVPRPVVVPQPYYVVPQPYYVPSRPSSRSYRTPYRPYTAPVYYSPHRRPWRGYR